MRTVDLFQKCFYHSFEISIIGIDGDSQFVSFIGQVADPTLKPANAYDLVICREVMEHLTVLQVRQTVANIVRMTSRFAYVTTRFHPNPASLLDFTTQFDVDPTHITLLNKDMLRLMFVLEGCQSRPDLEAKMDWAGKGRVLVLEKRA